MVDAVSTFYNSFDDRNDSLMDTSELRIFQLISSIASLVYRLGVASGVLTSLWSANKNQ